MQTLLLYLLIMALVVAAVFAVVWFVFGRGEELPPLDDATTLTRLPRGRIYGYDVRALRFALTVRGYKQSEVDWALARLADEVDDLHAQVQQLRDAMPVGSRGASGPYESTVVGPRGPGRGADPHGDSQPPATDDNGDLPGVLPGSLPRRDEPGNGAR